MAAPIDEKKLKTMSCYNISNLPNHILQEIFSKLSMANILNCRHVCKSWRSILSDADQFFAASEPTNLVLYAEERRSSHDLNLYWFEFREKYNHRQYSCDLTNTIRWKSRILSQFKFVNACKGLICLSESHSLAWFRPIMRILNPVTGESITLPPLEEDFASDMNSCALGFSSKSNHFKAVIIYRDFGNGSLANHIVEAQVYTLGNDRNRGWRSIGVVPQHDSPRMKYYRFSYNAFVCGSFHWLLTKSTDDSISFQIFAFDFDSEQFRYISLPPIHAASYKWFEIGVFEDSSIYFSCDSSEVLEVWLMKEYGMAESWTKMLVLLLNSFWMPRPWLVLKFFENGDVMFSCNGELWLYIHEEKICKNYSARRPNDRSSEIHALVVDTLNFASLKDIVAEDR